LWLLEGKVLCLVIFVGHWLM